MVNDKEYGDINSDIEDIYADEEDTLKDKYLTFHLAGEDYGIEIRFVTEIIGIQSITEVPDMPNFIKGVINLRGKVIPIMDVRLRFHLEMEEYKERTCIIVVNVNEVSVGLVVDKVNEVVNITGDKIEAPPKIKRGSAYRYIQGLGNTDGSVKIILNVNRLLYDDKNNKVYEFSSEKAPA